QPPAASAHTDLQALADHQPATEQYLQSVHGMSPVQEVAPPAFGPCCLSVLFIGLKELLLLVRISLEEEAADPVEGAAQPMEQFAHAAWGEPSTEGRLDPVAHLASRLEAAGGDFAFEAVELARPESARVALVLQGAERLQSTALVELQPVADGAGTDAE